jgi:oxalate decarboxylase/phosphoglucose isomerase-like protein (cupin superfamily)
MTRSGSLHFRIASDERLVRAGETVVVPSNVPHYFWNDSDEEAHTVQEFRPALNVEDFFDTEFALARAGKLNEKGLPNPLQMSVMLLEIGKVIRVTKPP